MEALEVTTIRRVSAVPSGITVCVVSAVRPPVGGII